MTKAMAPIERAREELANVERVPPGHFVSVSREGMTTICRALIAAEERVQELERAVRWALGEVDDFPAREPAQGAYWWRKELRERAVLAKRKE